MVTGLEPDKGLPIELFEDNPEEYLHKTVEQCRTAIDPKSQIGEIMATCWRSGNRAYRSYYTAEHMVSELEERLQMVGIKPVDSKRIIATWVQRN